MGAKSSRHEGEDVEVLCPGSYLFRIDRYYDTYQQYNQPVHYQEQVAKHVTKLEVRLQTQMKSRLFYPWMQYKLLDFFTH